MDSFLCNSGTGPKYCTQTPETVQANSAGTTQPPPPQTRDSTMPFASVNHKQRVEMLCKSENSMGPCSASPLHGDSLPLFGEAVPGVCVETPAWGGGIFYLNATN